MLSHVERRESSALFLEFLDFIKRYLRVFAKRNFLVSSSNRSTSTDLYLFIYVFICAGGGDGAIL